METNTEKTESTVKKLRKGVPFKKGEDPRRNLKGRPLGSVGFVTKFDIFLDKIAKQNGMTKDEVDEQLFSVAYKKAKDGDIHFYRDIFDRRFGKPTQTIQMDADIKNSDFREKVENIKKSIKMSQDNWNVE